MYAVLGRGIKKDPWEALLNLRPAVCTKLEFCLFTFVFTAAKHLFAQTLVSS